MAMPQGPGLVPAPLGVQPGDVAPAPLNFGQEPQREVVPPLDSGYAPPEPMAPRPLAPMPMPSAEPAMPPQSAPMMAPAPPSPGFGAPQPVAGMGPAPVRPAAPSPAAPPAPARAPAAVLDAPSGEEYPAALAQVVRAAKQRGAEAAPGDEVARARVRPTVEQAARTITQLPAGVTHDRLVRDALAEIAGMGAFEVALEDADVTALSVDHVGRVSTVRGGVHTAGVHWFSSASAAVECADRLLRANGHDRGARASVHAVLADGTRFVAVFPPMTHGGVVAQLERAPRVLSLADLGARGMLPPQAMNVVSQALTARRNIIVAGPRGSGRSTVLSALLGSLAPNERVLIVEDRDELARARRDALVVRASGDWSEAVHVALGLRAGRVVFGESHDASAKAFVSALVTGVEGSMIAVAAPNGNTALSRLAATGADEAWFPRHEAASRLGSMRALVIETARLSDGTVRVSGVGEARLGNDGNLQVAPMFVLQVGGPDAAGNIAAQLVPASGGY